MLGGLAGETLGIRGLLVEEDLVVFVREGSGPLELMKFMMRMFFIALLFPSLGRKVLSFGPRSLQMQS